jgi:hypothetical protein
VIVLIVVAIMPLSKYGQRIRNKIMGRLNAGSEAAQRELNEPERYMTAEEISEAELEKLQGLIEERKQIARDTDLSYHLWGLYISQFRSTGPQSLDPSIQDGEWYDVRIRQVSTANGLNEFEFELKGNRYKFVDDEERQGWRENIKFFSLFLYDAADRLLIEIPIKMRVDKWGRNYSLLSDGPRAFISGGWTSDFINVRLKHQSILNQEIRSQKHQERLREIEDLKRRFGILG